MKRVLLILYTYATTIFLASNDKAISKIQKTHSKRFHNLFLNNYYDNSVTPHDTDKVSFNFLSHVLTDHKKSLLGKELNFAIPPKDINYADYLLPFELLYSDVNSLRISNFDLDYIKATIRDSTFSSCEETSKFMENNFLKLNLMLLNP